MKSQKSRDADTHFKTGKTGSSTIRKTFGSLIHEQYKLNPVPRSQTDIDKRRFAHFKFDDKSEEILTKWMVENLGLSFCPYPKSAKEIDDLETLIINKLIPILNIDKKNTNNIHSSTIRLLRKQLSDIAYSKRKIPNSSFTKNDIIILPTSKMTVPVESNNIHKYEDIWNNIMPSVLNAVRNKKQVQIKLSKDIFDTSGKRKSYSFNLEFKNGKVTNNISGSAVARDLARVLGNNIQFKVLALNKFLKMKMDNNFLFQITY